MAKDLAGLELAVLNGEGGIVGIPFTGNEVEGMGLPCPHIEGPGYVECIDFPGIQGPIKDTYIINKLGKTLATIVVAHDGDVSATNNVNRTNLVPVDVVMGFSIRGSHGDVMPFLVIIGWHGKPGGNKTPATRIVVKT